MKETKGIVIGIKTESPLNKSKHLLEIELDQQDERLLNWHNKKVLIKRLSE